MSFEALEKRESSDLRQKCQLKLASIFLTFKLISAGVEH